MLLFLLIGLVVGGIIALTLLDLKSKRLIKAGKWSDKLMIKNVVKDIFLAFIAMMTISFLIPWIIWSLGEKDIVLDEVVTDTKPIYVIDDNKYYNIVENDAKKYIIVKQSKNSNELIQYDYSKAELKATSIIEKPQCEKISIYKNYKLVSKGIFANAVNDMFANPHLDKENLTYIGNKHKIYVPKENIY